MRDEGRVEEFAAQEYVAEKAVETIATFDVELYVYPPTLQPSPSEQRGFFSEALGGLVWMVNLGSIHADEPDTLRPAVEEHVDGVAVHDIGYRNRRP